MGWDGIEGVFGGIVDTHCFTDLFPAIFPAIFICRRVDMLPMSYTQTNQKYSGHSERPVHRAMSVVITNPGCSGHKAFVRDKDGEGYFVGDLIWMFG